MLIAITSVSVTTMTISSKSLEHAKNSYSSDNEALGEISLLGRARTAICVA